MSIPASGALRRSGGVVSAIGKQVKLINLKAVNRITVTFDPFSENVKSTRDFLFFLSIPRVAQTNPKCLLKTEVVCDRQPSEIKFSLIPPIQEQIKAKEIRFQSDNLTCLELLQLCNKHITALAPKEDVTNVIQTKSEKKTSGGAGKKGAKRK
ncbi:unnamed protein product [Hermetia illucens]|uniref:Large ribosomal subunit protein mL53 n=1 Tax=Hermetia illucens TaxID=343691 RepID=A0A7R8UXD6_HERIL|nr:uncharacterized protein LOC119653765 [Hermetia illucens]CAD7088326.1 unnamed protein product [Hermetia illucens]